MVLDRGTEILILSNFIFNLVTSVANGNHTGQCGSRDSSINSDKMSFS